MPMSIDEEIYKLHFNMSPLDIVNHLNEKFFENVSEDFQPPFSYMTDGISEAITFLEFPLWCNESDGYPGEDEAGNGIPLFYYVRDLYKALHSVISKAKPKLLF